MKLRSAIAPLLLGGALAWAPPARAQEGAVPRADALFREGRVLAERGDFAAACRKFAESQQLDPAVGTLLNIGDCEEHVGHLVRALRAFHDALRQLPPTDDREPRARTRISDLDKRVPRLTIELDAAAPREVQILVDGAPLASSDLGAATPADPGQHEIRVSSAGRPDRVIAVTVHEGEASTVVVEAPPPIATPAPSAPSTAPPLRPDAPPAAGPSVIRRAGWITVGVGALGVAAVGVSWGEMISDKHQVERGCQVASKTCSGPDAASSLDAAARGRTWTALNDVSWAVAAVGGALGTTLILIAPSPRAARVAVSAFASPSGGGVVGRLRF